MIWSYSIPKKHSVRWSTSQCTMPQTAIHAVPCGIGSSGDVAARSLSRDSSTIYTWMITRGSPYFRKPPYISYTITRSCITVVLYTTILYIYIYM